MPRKSQRKELEETIKNLQAINSALLSYVNYFLAQRSANEKPYETTEAYEKRKGDEQALLRLSTRQLAAEVLRRITAREEGKPEQEDKLSNISFPIEFTCSMPLKYFCSPDATDNTLREGEDKNTLADVLQKDYAL